MRSAVGRARARTGEPVINGTVGSLLEDDGSLSVLDSVVEALRETPPRVAAGYAPIGGSTDFLEAVIRDLLHDACFSSQYSGTNFVWRTR